MDVINVIAKWKDFEDPYNTVFLCNSENLPKFSHIDDLKLLFNQTFPKYEFNGVRYGEVEPTNIFFIFAVNKKQMISTIKSELRTIVDHLDDLTTDIYGCMDLVDQDEPEKLVDELKKLIQKEVNVTNYLINYHHIDDYF